MQRVSMFRRLGASAILCGTLALQTPIILGAEISPGDRDAVFEGAVLGCNEKMPAALRQRVGAAAVVNFCSCYAKEIASTITEEQLDALADWSRPVDAIPHYDETARNAWRACEKRLLTRDTSASLAPEAPRNPLAASAK